MTSPPLEHPYGLARALQPWAHGYLTRVSALPGRVGGFGFLGTRAEMELSSKSRYGVVEELHDDDPLKRPLLRWVHRLTEMRVNQLWLDEDERLLHEQEHAIREPEDTTLSIQAMKRGTLTQDAARAAAFRRNTGRVGHALFEHRAEYFARCREVHERLGQSDVLSYWSSYATPGSVSGEFEAHRGRIRELLGGCGVLDGDECLEAMQGHDHHQGWPARLTPHALASLFGASDFFRGAPLEVGALPARVVPASFLRGAYQLGRALHLAWAPSDRPLVALRDPDDWAGHRFGFLCLLWFLSATFDRQVLDLSLALTRARRRSAARVLLSHLALQLVRTEAHERALDHRFGANEVEDLGRGLFREPLHRNGAFVGFSVRRDEAARTSAWLDAAATFQEYVEEFDEDFMRDPRAREKLRADAAAPAPVQSTRERAQAGLAWLLGAVAEGLG